MHRFTFDDCQKAAFILQEGGIVAFPTETVYGLACRFDSKTAFERLNAVKKRPADKPYTMMLADPNRISEYAHVSKKQQKLISAFMPGEVTFIFKKKASVPDFVTLEGETIGVRVPGHEQLRQFLAKVGVPLLVPSANKSGEAPCKNYAEIERIFGDAIDGAIDGEVGDGVPSTVVLLTGDEPKVLRQGKVTAGQILSVWNS